MSVKAVLWKGGGSIVVDLWMYVLPNSKMCPEIGCGTVTRCLSLLYKPSISRVKVDVKNVMQFAIMRSI